MTAIEFQKMECDVTFLSKSDEGWGRAFVPVLNGNWYRPHLVVGDPTQRKAKVVTRTFEEEQSDGSRVLRTSHNWIDEECLPISFDSAPENLELNKPFRAKLVLMYWPHPQYEILHPGVTFTVREGASVVGVGEVIGWLAPEPLNVTPRPL